MSKLFKEIEKYTVIHVAVEKKADGSINPAKTGILCWAGGYPIGNIIFYPKDQVPACGLSSGSLLSGDKAFYLKYEIDRYQEIIETLRYEKPVYVSVEWDENDQITGASVGTLSEPIGEQEGFSAVADFATSTIVSGTSTIGSLKKGKYQAQYRR